MRPFQNFAALILVCICCAACGGSNDPRELTELGNKALNSGDAEEAAESFDKALTVLAGKTTDPQYRAAKLGAIDARVTTDAKKAAKDFLDYAAAAPTQVKDSDYISLSGKLADKNAVAEALTVIDAGKKAYGDSKKLADQLDRIVKLAKDRAATDPNANAALKGLGYL